MKISEVIKSLQHLMVEHGDLPVFTIVEGWPQECEVCEHVTAGTANDRDGAYPVPDRIEIK